MSGDIKLNVGSDLVRSLGCNDLTRGTMFTLLLGSDTNVLSYSLPDSQLKVPIKIETDEGFIIFINQLPVCDIGQRCNIMQSPIDMNLHLIKNVKSPVNKLNTLNKSYADRIKCKTAFGNIPNFVMTEHTLFPISRCESFCQWKNNNM